MENEPQVAPNTQYVTVPQTQAPVQQAPVQYAQTQQVMPVQTPVKKAPSGWGIFFLCCLALGVITLGEVIGFFVGEATPIGWDMGSVAGGAVFGIICIVALGGAKLLSPTHETWTIGWKTAWWFIAVSAILFLLDLVSVLMDDTVSIQPGWLMRLFEAALLCLVIGLSEEIMLRGVALGGLLAPLGKTKRGVWIAIVLSSLFFGLLHIDFTTTDLNDMLQLVQAILKVAQTGVYGFALACIVVATEDVFTCAIMHGLDDFLLFIVSVVLLNEGTTTEYVTTDESDAIITIIVYVVITLLYLPVAFKAAKLVKEMPEPTRGVFYKSREEKKAAKAAASAQAAGMPVQPYAMPIQSQSQTLPTYPQGFANSSQNATELDAATLSESTSFDMGMTTVASDPSMTGFERP